MTERSTKQERFLPLEAAIDALLERRPYLRKGSGALLDDLYLLLSRLANAGAPLVTPEGAPESLSQTEVKDTHRDVVLLSLALNIFSGEPSGFWDRYVSADAQMLPALEREEGERFIARWLSGLEEAPRILSQALDLLGRLDELRCRSSSSEACEALIKSALAPQLTGKEWKPWLAAARERLVRAGEDMQHFADETGHSLIRALATAKGETVHFWVDRMIGEEKPAPSSPPRGGWR